ncbi:MAG TPA: pyridoxal-phosphate dependent enzyme [Candidatus Paceibacterota bacterium]|nr:pyridoxal-phosphate dependent enzyme [Candidatus Paceibacterota bacterium]
MKAVIAKKPRNAVVRAMDPEGMEFLDAYPMDPPFGIWRKYGIRLVPLVAFQRIPHVKAIPGFWMLMRLYLLGKLKGIHTIVVDSSGNTAHAVARLAVALGFRVKVVLSTDTPESKKGIIASLSTVELIEVPGGVAKRARKEARLPGHYHLNQYADPANLDAHFRFTGPEIVRALGIAPDVICCAMGTGGTAGGVAKYFKKHYPKTKVIGARPILGQDIPGARDKRRMKESKIRWKLYLNENHDVFVVSRKDAFIAMRMLWQRMGTQAGPTSGLAYRGLEKYLKRYLKKLSPARRKALKGKIFVVLCSDDGRFYPERIGGELRPEQGRLPRKKTRKKK